MRLPRKKFTIILEKILTIYTKKCDNIKRENGRELRLCE
jgi:hypothetical protein